MLSSVLTVSPALFVTLVVWDVCFLQLGSLVLSGVLTVSPALFVTLVVWDVRLHLLQLSSLVLSGKSSISPAFLISLIHRNSSRPYLNSLLSGICSSNWCLCLDLTDIVLNGIERLCDSKIIMVNLIKILHQLSNFAFVFFHIVEIVKFDFFKGAQMVKFSFVLDYGCTELMEVE